MRRILLAVALCCAAFPGVAWAKPKFPYIAYVATDDAALRSGPADEHYATDRPEKGTKLEVHRHDPGGWYAVRPLPGSYCWLPARQAEMTSESDVAQVTADDAVAWIGTRTGQAEDLKYQIEFKQGDLVEVLGAKRMKLPESKEEEVCYKIAPPAGEFRWIKSKHVTRRGADELAEEPVEEPAVDRGVRRANFEAPVDSTESGVATAGAAPSADGFVPRKKNRPAGSATPVAAAPAASSPSEPAPTSEDDDDFALRLRDLDVELSLKVAGDPANWNLAPLRQKTAALMDSGQTALQRARARLLLEKIDEFADFAHRRPIGAASGSTVLATPDPKPKNLVEPKTTSESKTLVESKSLVEPPTPEDKPQRLIDTTKTPIGSGVKGTRFAPDIEPRYDGMGWLMQVVNAQNRSTPRYALLDSEGKVLQYVTPAPGLNLNRYLRTQVGIYGKRGYVPRLQTPHLTAERIVALERHRK